MDQVIWAMATRCNPGDNIELLRNTWSTTLDPAQNPPEKRVFGSKALINACKDYRYLKTFSRRTTLRKSVYDRVSARWSELGLPGRAPGVLAFETSDEPPKD
jgi:4-hydroxy-3-polyprenylbenzoate decarboxylase